MPTHCKVFNSPFQNGTQVYVFGALIERERERASIGGITCAGVKEKSVLMRYICTGIL